MFVLLQVCEGVVVACDQQTKDYLVCSPSCIIELSFDSDLYVSAYVTVQRITEENWAPGTMVLHATVLPNPSLLEMRYIPRVAKDDYFDGIVIVGF